MYNLYLSVYLDFNDKVISGTGTIIVVRMRDPTLFLIWQTEVLVYLNSWLT